MLIGIDGNEANVTNQVGVNTYAYELLRNLHKLQDIWKDKHRLIVYLKEKPRPDMPNETQNFKYKVITGKGLWILTKLMPDLFFGKPKPDIFFSPSHYIPIFAPMPRVCSIMDLGYLEFSDQFRKIDFWQLKVWSAISIFISKAIIAISNSTLKDIVRHYPFAKNKIYVTHLAYDLEKIKQPISLKDVRRVKNKYSIVEDYVLYLGTLKPSKNIEGLLDAFKEVVNDNRLKNSTQLVIAGKKGWLYQTIFEKVEKLGLKDNVVFTDFISEDDKYPLIKGAKVFALTSFWEGFGLDALNAMALGVPVVASNTGSLPEVLENSGELVDPKDTKSIAEGLRKILFADTAKYNSIIEAGLKQAGNFSWEKCARQTLNIIENVKR